MPDDRMTENTVRQMKMAILQAGRSPEDMRDEHGDYDLMCKTLMGREPGEADTFAVLDGEFPEQIDVYDVLVITGSRHGVYEDHDWIAPLEDLLRTAFKRGKKIVAICFGHQILAQALGGKVEKSDKGFGIGVMDYRIDGMGEADGVVSLCAWHQDQIVEAPEGAEVIAASDFCPIAGLRYGDQAISFQPHPEFSKAYVAGLIEARRGTVISEELADIGERSLDKETSTPAIQKLLTQFLAQS